MSSCGHPPTFVCEDLSMTLTESECGCMMVGLALKFPLGSSEGYAATFMSTKEAHEVAANMSELAYKATQRGKGECTC